MISKVAAGGGAAALTAFAIGVSLRHGIFVAGLAFVGGFVSPAIIGSETPNTPVLFGYLLAIAAGTLWPSSACAAGGRSAGACWLGSAIWTVLWMLSLAGGLHWVGLFLVAVAGLFVWATWRRLGESENPTIDVAALVWAALGVTGVADRGADRPGRRQADRRLARAGGAWSSASMRSARWTPRFQYVAALAPVLSIAALALWWADTRGTGPDSDSEDFAWRAILFGGLYRRGAPSPCCGTRRGRASGRRWPSPRRSRTSCSAWYVLRGVAVGTPWGLISIALAAAVPGRRRAAGALARQHARRHRGAGLLRGGRRLLHRRRHRARAQPRMDHGGLCRRVRRRGRASPAGSASTPCASCAGRCSPS